MQTRESLSKAYLENARLAGSRTPERIASYQLQKLFSYLDELGLTLNLVGYKQAVGYRQWLRGQQNAQGKPYTTGSLSNFLGRAYTFYVYLKEQGLVVANPFTGVNKLKAGARLPRAVLKEKETETFFNELSCYDKAQSLRAKMVRYRTHVIAELLYATGLRIAELASLKISDVDFKRGVIELVAGKGGKSRTVYLTEYAQDILKLYLEEMRPLLLRAYSNATLLFGTSAYRLTMLVNRELKAVAAGLDLPAVTCHSFRHMLGFHLLRAGCDMRYIQAILGHTKISTTEVYTKIDKEDLKKVIDTFHPRGGAQAEAQR